MEQTAIYDILSVQPYHAKINAAGHTVGSSGPWPGFLVSNYWWLALTSDEKRGFGSVAPMLCPTRRGGVQINDYGSNPADFETSAQNTNESGYGWNGAGPLGDYAFVFGVTGDPRPVGATWWFQAVDIPNSVHRAVRSPFRKADHTLSGGKVIWSPSDTFARCTDGLSNQFFIGEKHIPIGRLGQCPNMHPFTSATAAQARNAGDCSYLQVGYVKSIWSGRALVTLAASAQANAGFTVDVEYVMPLSRPDDFSLDAGAAHWTNSALTWMSFGGWHPGVCNFVLGDGAVRGVSVTTSEAVLRAFALVDDGASVSLP